MASRHVTSLNSGRGFSRVSPSLSHQAHPAVPGLGMTPVEGAIIAPAAPGTLLQQKSGPLNMTLKRRLLGGLIALCAVAAIGWLDYVTGVDIGLSLFYLIPIGVTGWLCGWRIAAFVAFVAGTVWLAADISLRGPATSVGVSLWNAFTRYVIYISEGVFIALLRRDRELLREAALQQSSLARTDQTTRLPNARAFAEAAEVELARSRAADEPVCLLYVDLDNFKTVNDTLGHAAGDAVLQQVADALAHTVRPGDLAARLGGDEFALLLRAVPPEAAEAVAQRIVSLVAQVASENPCCELGATVGVAYFEKNLPEDTDALLHTADELMYRGKREGKGRVVLDRL